MSTVIPGRPSVRREETPRGGRLQRRRPARQLPASRDRSMSTLTKPARVAVLAVVRLLAAAGSNQKLGQAIHSWSLPAIDTCPGATDFCKSLCYALRSHFMSAHVQKLYARNLKLSRRSDFAFRMAREIRNGTARTVRIHVSGDFYSAAYVRKWIAIAQACPSCRFFCYSRSWRDPKILPTLLELATLPNVVLWWSEDRETGPSPATPGVRACFLVQDESDEDLVDPRRHALVFRDGRHRRASLYPGYLKQVNAVRICPHEQTPVRRSEAMKEKFHTPVTCSVCRLCSTHFDATKRGGLTILS